MFFDLIKNRRSKRKFTDRAIDKETISLLIEAALRSPSSRSFNPWRFIVVDNRDLLDKLSKAKPHGASFLRNAPLGIVVCADTEKSDTCVEDCSIASIFIQLAAEALNLASCWVQIRLREHNSSFSADEYIKGLLKIPDNIMVESIIAIGYPDEVKKGHSRDSLDDHKVFYNRYDAE